MPTLRPADPTGDIQPVLSISNLIQNAAAVEKHLYYRLKLPSGEWWEYPDQGNQILRMLQTSRLTEADAPALSSYLTSYIMETPGVFSVENAETAVTGRAFRFSCTVITSYGKVEASFSSGDLG